MSSDSKRHIERANEHLKTAEEYLQAAGEHAKKAGDAQLHQTIKRLETDTKTTHTEIDRKLGQGSG